MIKTGLLNVILLLFSAAYTYAQTEVMDLSVDFLSNPLGMENTSPVLGWQLKDDRLNISQTAFQIIVASSYKKVENGEGDVWDTGKQLSDLSANIRYKGAPLISRQRYFWKVKVWNNEGESTDFSAIHHWEMGLLNKEDWKAKWISQVPDTASAPQPMPAPLFRSSFDLVIKIKKARAYVSGVGYYELYLNGQKVGDHELDPAISDYNKRVKYVTYDISKYLNEGENVVGAMLGSGWYNKHVAGAWDFHKAPWRNVPALLCQLEIEYMNGTKEIISTDDSWKVNNGPIVFDGILNGEVYDARKEIPDWHTKTYNAKSWESSVGVKGPKGRLSAQVMPPIRKTKLLKPKSIHKLSNGNYLVDFGQNMAGRIRLSMSGHKSAEVVIRYGERLQHIDDANEMATLVYSKEANQTQSPESALQFGKNEITPAPLDQKELSRFVFTGETQTDRYISNGEKTQSWAPTFTYYGFQYVEIEGYPGKFDEHSITAQVLHTDLEEVGSFSSSNDLFNQLQAAAEWSFLSNYYGYPTDCPHREKIGWSGDAQLAAEFGIFNFQMHTAYTKWIDDFCDEQQTSGQVSGIIPTSGWGYTFGRDTTLAAYNRGYGPQWEAAFVTVPWYLYQYYGDTTVLSRYYPYLKKYQAYLTEHSQDYLLAFGIDDHKPVTTLTEGPILASGFYYGVTTILQQVAEILKKDGDANFFKEQARNIKKAFNAKYYNGDGSYGNGGQTSISEALYFGLTTPEEKEKVIQALIEDIKARDYHFDAGVVGVKFITNVLMTEGRHEVLYKMLNQTDYPSFGHWIKSGATTLWQEWDGSRSRNHIMFGSFTEFFYKGLAGINADVHQPGFKHFYLKPRFIEDIDWVKASHKSPYGAIKSEWTRENGKITFDITIPTNSSATVVLPKGAFEVTAANNILSNENLSFLNDQSLKLGSGQYRIVMSE